MTNNSVGDTSVNGGPVKKRSWAGRWRQDGFGVTIGSGICRVCFNVSQSTSRATARSRARSTARSTSRELTPKAQGRRFGCCQAVLVWVGGLYPHYLQEVLAGSLSDLIRGKPFRHFRSLETLFSCNAQPSTFVAECSQPALQVPRANGRLFTACWFQL